ncbi:MAG: hypothetical protein M0R06_11350, partial [Sphaerochaeta sp.]|nr:hypothetical protein [Sphaerochaeta sp.]
MSKEMMICPKAKECPYPCMGHGKHSFGDDCVDKTNIPGVPEGFCPACIPYIPEYECTFVGQCGCAGDKEYCEGSFAKDSEPCPHWQPKKPTTCAVETLTGEHCPNISTKPYMWKGKKVDLCMQCAANVKAGAFGKGAMLEPTCPECGQTLHQDSRTDWKKFANDYLNDTLP